jgi:hypothetical protein
MKQLSEWHGGPLTELSEQQVTKIVKAYFDNPFYGSTIEGQVIVANPVVPPVTMPAIISTKPPEARAEIDYNDPDVIARVEAANRLLGTVSMNINGKPTDVVPIEEAVRHAVQLASRVKTPEEIAEEIAALAKKSPDLSKQDQRNTKNGEQPQLSEEMTEQLRLQFAALEKQVGENQAKMALETAVREAYRKFSQPPGLLKRAKALKVAKENLTRRMAAFDHLSRKRILGPIIGAALLGPAETKVKKAEADYLAFQKQIADAIKGAPKI